MQNEFCLEQGSDHKIKLKESILALIDPINKSIAKFKTTDAKVIWLNWGVDSSSLQAMSESQLKAFNSFEYPDSMSLKAKLNDGKKVLEKGSWSARIIKDLKQTSNDYYIDKQRMSGFWYTGLDELLKTQGINNLYFAGINTNQCVQATLQDGHFIGYQTTLLKDCTSTSSPKYCFDAAIYNIENCYGQVLNLGDL